MPEQEKREPLIFQLFKDEKILQPFSTSQTNLGPYLERDFCGSARGYYSIVKYADGTLLDRDIFTFTTGIAEDLTPVANLTVHATERRHVGTYELLITEKSQVDRGRYFETRVVVIVEDYCLGAEIDLSLEALSIPYMPLSNQELTASLDLNAIEESFTVDREHRDVCTPIVFSHSLILLQGSLDPNTYFKVNEQTKEAYLTIPPNLVYTKFFLLVNG